MSFAIHRRETTTLLLIAGSAALVAAIYFDSFASMARVWSFSGYRHGVIVFPISAYLLWRLRGPLAGVDLRPWPFGVAVVAGLVACWLLSRATGVQTAEHLAIVLLVPAVVATCLGVELARRALFPLLFLIVAVPVGDALIPYLMRITADVSAALLRLTGVPVYREGQYITLPGGEFEVADVCSGLRYLVAGTMISLLFAYLTYRSNVRRVLFVAATAFALIFANGLRAFIVMWVASASEMRLLAGEDHIYFGWILFAVLIGGMFLLGTRYAEEEPVGTGTTAVGGVETARLLPVVLVLGVLMLAITARPLQQQSSGASWLVVPAGALVIWAVSRARARPARDDAQPAAAANPYRGLAGALVISLTVALLVAGPALLNRSSTPSRAPAAFEWPAIAACGTGRWDGIWQPIVRAPDSSSAATYHCGEHTIHAFVAQYMHSVQGSELVSEQHRLYPEEWRRYVIERKSRFDAADGRSVEVNEIGVDGGGRRALIWYWYRVGDATATRPVVVKLEQAFRLLTGRAADGAIYWLETPMDSARDDARSRLEVLALTLEDAWSTGRIRSATN